MRLKVSSAKWRTFCIGLNVLMKYNQYMIQRIIGYSACQSSWGMSLSIFTIYYKVNSKIYMSNRDPILTKYMMSRMRIMKRAGLASYKLQVSSHYLKYVIPNRTTKDELQCNSFVNTNVFSWWNSLGKSSGQHRPVCPGLHVLSNKKVNEQCDYYCSCWFLDREEINIMFANFTANIPLRLI